MILYVDVAHINNIQVYMSQKPTSGNIPKGVIENTCRCYKY